jgi:hypothetical protein
MTIYKDVSDLLEEYLGNELALYILHTQSFETRTLNIVFERLGERQDEIYREIMKACGLPFTMEDLQEEPTPVKAVPPKAMPEIKE